ncbi:MAG TPA: alpha/beta hydrolase [Dehalococcoidales bacterium]|nr:alpha/beta hydrolase [Dehalococcoidales bacterium]
MINPYSYEAKPAAFNLRLTGQSSHWRPYSVSFPIAHPGIFQESTLAFGEYYQPEADGKAPLVILVHGWGDRSVIPVRMLAKRFARQGINTFILYLPFHSRRLPVDMKKRSPNLTAQEWYNGYIVAVTDVRQIIDWAGTIDKINTQKIAVIGLSLGGFVTSIAMGIDNRIKAGVFIVTGGNSGKINRLSRVGSFRRGYQVSTNEYETSQRLYSAYLDEVARAGWENVEPPVQSFLTDPMTFASKLRKRPVMMLNAKWDEFIPGESTLDFFNACGDTCDITWFPSTHATIWLFYPAIAGKISRFIHAAFVNS